MANTQTTTTVLPNMSYRMPSPRGKDSLRFRGKNIVDFLTEFEHFAGHASLTETQKCEEIRIYFAKKEKRVLDVLDGFVKKELQSLYTSSAEKKTYQSKDIQKFTIRKRKISKLLHFDTYRREFRVIAKSLEKRQALSTYDRDDYFWSGIQPISLREILEVELKNKNFWKDITVPPPMDRVVEVALVYLNREAYQPRDISLRSRLAKRKTKKKVIDDSEEESSEGSSEEDEGSETDESSSDSEMDEPVDRKKSVKKKSSVREENSKEVKMEVQTSPKSDPVVQSNIEDLAERFKRLELQLGERVNREPQAPRFRTLYCVMCGREGHGICDCAEAKMLLGHQICRLDTNNRVVMSDGTALPRAEGSGGSAKIIKARMGSKYPAMGPTSTSAPVEVVSDEAYYNGEPEELAVLGAMEFKVMPAEHTEKAKKVKPYDRKEVKKVGEKTVPEVIP